MKWKFKKENEVKDETVISVREGPGGKEIYVKTTTPDEAFKLYKKLRNKELGK